MKRALSRSEKRLYLLSGVVTTGLITFVLVWSHLSAEPDWTIPEPQPMPSPNGYDIYRSAELALIKPVVDDLVEYRQDSEPPMTPEQRAVRFSLARRTGWLKQNTKAERLFEQAKAAESLCPQKRGYQGLNYKGYWSLSQLKTYKRVALNTAKIRGDWNDAAKNGLDIIEMAGDQARGGSFHFYQAGARIEADAVLAFRDIPRHLTRNEARRAAQRLETLMLAHPSAVDAMHEAKWHGVSLLRDSFQTASWRHPDAWRTSGDEISLEDKATLRFLSQRQIVESYKRVWDWNIAHINQPYSRSPATSPESGTLINRNLIHSFPTLQYEIAKANTRLTLLHLRLWLRVYRMEKGAYPTTLKELTPAYIAKVPRDPFGNNTLMCYQKRGDDYLLWSIGRHESKPSLAHLEAFGELPGTFEVSG